MRSEQTDASREKSFKLIKTFNRASPQEYQTLSLDFVRSFHGPKLPDHAFTSIQSIQTWYKTVLFCWLSDVHFPAELWEDKLESNESALALLNILFEALNTGIRKIQKSIFRDYDDKFRKLPITSHAELNKWCDLMFDLLEDDEEYVSNKRDRLTIRYDKGVKYRYEQNLAEYKKTEHKENPLGAAMVIAFERMISNTGKARRVEIDDSWISLCSVFLYSAKFCS